MQQIVHLPQPVIAAVQGTATAAGCQLVASCDLAVASRPREFATPGVNIGLFCSTPMVALSRNVARQARDGNAADRRRDLGRGRRRASASSIAWSRREPNAKRRSRSPARLPQSRATSSRSARRRSTGRSRWTSHSAYDYAAEVMVENMMARDAAEGISAFIEKRTAMGGPLMTLRHLADATDPAGAVPRGSCRHRLGSTWARPSALNSRMRRDLPRMWLHDAFQSSRHRRSDRCSVPPSHASATD